MLNYLIRLNITLMIIFINSYVVFSGEYMDAGEIVQKIEYNESLIRDVQCKLRWFETKTNLVYKDCEWGYENGKEFSSGTHYGKTKEGDFLPYTSITAFDGKVTRSYKNASFFKTSMGGIYGYDPHTFSVPTSPKTLLGYTLDQDGIYTLSELLSDKFVKVKKARLEKFKDKECIILEAIGFQAEIGKPIYDIRIWIDPKRNYRPLKIEKYISSDDKNSLAGLRGERWTYLATKIHGIELKQIDGIWFPACGERMVYTIKPEFLLNGITEEEIRKKYPGMSDEDIAKKIKLISVPFHARRKIELSEIRINKGIDPAKFTINFPYGCGLWDDLAGIGYTVGDPENAVSDEIKKMNLREMMSIEPGLSLKTSLPIKEKKDTEIRPIVKETPKRITKAIKFIGLIFATVLIIFIFLVVTFFRGKK